MTEWIQQWTYIIFCVKFELPPQKLFGWFRRPQLWATGDWQLHMTMCLLIHHILCRVFWWNITSPRWLSPPIAQIWRPATSAFSQNWNHLWKGSDFRPSLRFRKIQQGQLVAGRTVWGPKVLTLNGTEVSLSYVHSFLYLVSSWINVSIFHSTWLDTFWTGLMFTYISVSNF